MGFQAMKNMIAKGEMVGVVVLIVIGIVLLALKPGTPIESGKVLREHNPASA